MDGSAIIRSDDLRSQNRRRLLHTLRDHGPSTPSRLSQLTGLSAASISTLSSQMIDQGILQSDKRPVSRLNTARGRPQSQLSLNSDAGDCAILNLTIDSISTRRVDYAGRVCQSHDQHLQTRELSARQIVSTAIHAIEQVCSSDETKRLHHIGVAFQGMTEHSTGNLLWSPIIRHQNVPLGAALGDHFAVEVSVNNDCGLISQALSREKNTGLGDSFATLFFSHGVGLGLYLDGKPFAGTRSSALEIGHLRFEPSGALCRCGKRGCIEAYAADYGIARMAEGISLEDEPAGRVSAFKMNALVDDAYAGDRAAVQAFTIAGAAVGEGLANLFTLLDPMPVALVGRSQRAFDLMRDGIDRILAQQLRSDVSANELLYCVDEVDALLESGLIHHSLSSIDAHFSRLVSDISVQVNGC